MKQVEVQILGQVYMLGCPDGGESLLRDAVAAVDREMTIIRDAGKVKARERIAVLAALNLAYQLAEGGAAAVAPAVAAESGKHAAGALQNGAEQEIDTLVRRIDAALADDGQLL